MNTDEFEVFFRKVFANFQCTDDDRLKLCDSPFALGGVLYIKYTINSVTFDTERITSDRFEILVNNKPFFLLNENELTTIYNKTCEWLSGSYTRILENEKEIIRIKAILDDRFGAEILSHELYKEQTPLNALLGLENNGRR